jgi:hypothetical protein
VDGGAVTVGSSIIITGPTYSVAYRITAISGSGPVVLTVTFETSKGSLSELAGTFSVQVWPGVVLTNPHVYYVRSDGNDTTGDGSPSAPYLTGQKAYDTAVTAAMPSVLDFGVGTFYITLPGNWDPNVYTVRGCGAGSQSLFATFLTVNATPATSTNSNGVDAFTIDVEALDMTFAPNSTGGALVVNDTNTYTGGHGGQIIVRGNARVIAAVTGGTGNSVGDGGDINGGAGGGVILFGCVNASTVNILGGAGVGTGVMDGVPGTLAADGCDLTGGISAALGASITLGRCSYVFGITVTTDKGGNAIY